MLRQILTVGALHQADSNALKDAASTWHDELAPLLRPLLVVNVGGPTGNLRIKVFFFFPLICFAIFV